MRNPHKTHLLCRLAVFCTALCALTVIPVLTRAQPSASIKIVNNSNRQILHAYLSPIGSDTWSTNQLGDSAIAPSQSSSVNNSACNAQQIKVIGEDQDGCFLSAVVACGGDITWTITNNTPADCGQ